MRKCDLPCPPFEGLSLITILKSLRNFQAAISFSQLDREVADVEAICF